MKRRLLKLWGDLPLPFWLRRWMVLTTVSKFPVGVIGVITDERGRVLMFRHSYRGEYPWGLPSGWLEKGESPEVAIEWEITEETGLTARAEGILLVLSEAHFRQLDLIYRCRLLGGEFSPSAEVTGIEWFDRTQLPAMSQSQCDIMGKIFQVLDEVMHV